jgi:hypothetical protein
MIEYVVQIDVSQQRGEHRPLGGAGLRRGELRVRDRAILETLYSTSMRRMELVGLGFYDLDRGTLMIRQGKGKKDRMIPIGERAIVWIEKYRSDVRPQFVMEPDGGVLFLTAEGDRFSPNGMTSLVRNYVLGADLGKRGACHLFRHTMATQMLENGADIRFIQQMLGHAKLETTQIYTQVSIRKLQEIHRATHPTSRHERKPSKAITEPEASPAEDLLATLEAESRDLLRFANNDPETGSAVLARRPCLARDADRLRTSCSSGRMRLAKAVPEGAALRAALLAEERLIVESPRRSRLNPVHDLQPAHVLKMLLVVSDEGESKVECMRRNHRVERTDGCSLRRKPRGDLAESTSGFLVERNDVDIPDESVDQSMQSSRVAPISAEAKFGQRDGADPQLRRPLGLDLLRDITFSSKGIADGVRIEKKFHAKGSRALEIGCCFGRSISSSHWPRQARKVSDHSSAGARTTRSPSR